MTPRIAIRAVLTAGVLGGWTGFRAGAAESGRQADATGSATEAPGKAAPPRALRPRRPVRALVVEHDDASLAGTSRHLLRATVPTGLGPEALRRCLDLALDEERIMHPGVDAVALYLYEEQTYARFTGMATPLDAAVAHLLWAPGGDWNNQARSLSRLDNRTLYTLPHR